MISGSGTVTESGPNVLTLTNANTYNGNTSVTGGTLTIGATGAIVGTGVSVDSGGTLNVASGGSISNATNLTNNGIVAFNNPARTIATLNGTNGSATLTLNGTALTLSGGSSYAGAIADGASSGSLLVTGGTLTLNGANSYSGGTTVNAGTLIAGSTTAFGTAAGASLAFGASSTGAVYLSGDSMTIVGLQSNLTPGTPTVQNASANPATLTIANAVPNTYAGVLQDGAGGGPLSLTLSGTSTLTLTGTGNIYTGTTNINSGTLRVSNPTGSATGSGPVNVNSGGTLAGGIATPGAILGTVTVGNGGAIAPSGGSAVSAGLSSVGTLTVGGLTLNGSGGATLNYQAVDASAVSDLIAVNGVLAIPTSGTTTFNFYSAGTTGDYTFVPGDTYQLISYNSVTGGGFEPELRLIIWQRNRAGGLSGHVQHHGRLGLSRPGDFKQQLERFMGPRWRRLVQPPVQLVGEHGSEWSRPHGHVRQQRPVELRYQRDGRQRNRRQPGLQ